MKWLPKTTLPVKNVLYNAAVVTRLGTNLSGHFQGCEILRFADTGARRGPRKPVSTGHGNDIDWPTVDDG